MILSVSHAEIASSAWEIGRHNSAALRGENMPTNRNVRTYGRRAERKGLEKESRHTAKQEWIDDETANERAIRVDLEQAVQDMMDDLEDDRDLFLGWEE